MTGRPRIVLEGFAGPGGWSTGLRMLDLPEHKSFGVEWDMDACRTAQAAGHVRVRADVAALGLSALTEVWLLIMSAPCQAWSRAGRRQGIRDQEAIFRHAERVIAAGEWIPYPDAGPLPAGTGDSGSTWHDQRSTLVLEILRWAIATQPENIALEQVPDVLPFFRLIGRWLTARGYSVASAVLSTERYGVAQTRQRAILVAYRTHTVTLPEPTHTAYDAALPGCGRWAGMEGDLFGRSLLPWVSMEDCLGWGFPARPAPTVTGGGTDTGGAEVFGNAGMRHRLALHANRDSVKITVEEAALLQSFPPGYPWQGTKSAQHRQVGDAVPPLLAAHVVAEALGMPSSAAVRAQARGREAS